MMSSDQGLYQSHHEHDACGIGFVVNIQGKQSHQIVEQALTVLHNLDHRGATGSEKNTGDGAGILLQIPHKFLDDSCQGLGITLPGRGQYGVGMIFLPPGREERLACEKVIKEVVKEEEQEVLGWRKVPTDNFYLGQSAKDAEPSVRQLFIGRSPDIRTELEFERKLYVIRRKITKRIENSDLADKEYLYINSLSSRTIIYKGMLTSTQLKDFYPDLTDPKMESALALVHSRFSTNTFPNWKLAHPFRYLIHNGEINTLRGNQNWMHAREAQLSTDLFDVDMDTLTPIIQEDGSDSAKFDNCLEFLLLSGRSLPHAMMMMIPEPWEKHESMDDEMKAFYEYHSCLMEPWDGPASIAFTDGKMVGATLDRNGLRPSRYYVTSDDMIVLSSEVGVLDIPPEDIVYKDRLQPGRMLLIDTQEGRIKSDEEIKHQIAREYPYREWLDENLIDFHDLPYNYQEEPENSHEDIIQRQKVFGYTYEDLNVNVGPMAENMLQPVGAMGNDAPIAVLSNEPQLLYNYFKQLFAQVTNPPIDPIREELITSTETILGSEGNILETTAESCRQIRLKTPVLKNEELAQLKNINDLSGFKSKTLPILFDVNRGGEGLEEALDELFAAADKAVEEGVNILILSDRDFNLKKAPIPALLAVAGLHHHLIRSGNRTKVGLVLESGEPRETHHFCTLLGYGVEAVNPYMAYESLHDLIREGHLDLSFKRAQKGYNKAVVKGIVKVMSKMGISTIKSYRGAQIFEALGLDKELVDKYFTWTDSRIGGIGLDTIALEAKMRHREAYPNYRTNGQVLDEGGQYKWRKGSEYHAYNPKTVHTLQLATKNGDYELYKEYSNLIDEQSDPPAALRSLLKLKTDESGSIPLEEVESVEEICKRFKTGAMSYGSISKETHEALAIAMNRVGGKSNTGEGGEDPSRYTPDPNGDSRNSAVKQVASGRFGVTSEYLTQGKEIQIKMAQGAKPGEGGELPGRKVYPWIADVRLSTPGVGLISPPPHHDIYSIEDLAQLIHDLKNANKDALINVKLVSAVGVGTIATGVAKGHADVILISGHDGGTGASPQTSIKHAGLPWELGLSETHQTLVLNDLRSRVTLETDGQIKTGRDIAVAALLGAEEFGFGTSALITLGCIMMRVCHLDTCPVGIATQNPELRHKFTGDPAYVVNFMKFVAQELREYMAELGFRTIDEMIGRTDKLVQAETDHWKARHLDLSPILHRPEIAENVGTRCMICQNHGLENALDIQTLMDICEPALSDGKSVRATLPIKNTNRVVGTIVGSEVTRRFGSKGLSEDTIHLKFEGSAGQSFGAFIPSGMTLELEGDANDYFGKGLSGGKLILYPSKNARFDPAENIIVGNVSFYGATSGQAYIRGKAGERFCVRNSGLHAVVESVGDHACEYMTGGRVVVLGETGRNFAAGMSGGIAYILDLNQQFHKRCNTNRVVLEQLRDEDEIDQVYEMVRRHAEYTDSHRGWRVLAKWDEMIHRFVKVLPKDFKKMQQSIEKAQQEGLDKDEAEMEAFLQNK